MDASRLLALGIFASYFLLIISLFSFVVVSLRHAITHTDNANGTKSAVCTFVLLALVSFVHTWYYMFGFMAWSFHDFEKSTLAQSDALLERLTDWLRGTELFEQAWATVCAGPLNWWWSEQLCLFTVGAWTVFLSTQGRKHNIKFIWAYMLLGQVVAISVASNLFYLALCLSAPMLRTPRSKSPLMAPPGLWISVILSLATVGLVPFTSERTFLPNLLAMHALLIIPLFSSAPRRRKVIPKGGFFISVHTLYSIISFIALVIHIRTFVSAHRAFPEEGKSIKGSILLGWEVLHSHPAQSSIGWDVVWTTISFCAWAIIGPRADNAAPKRFIQVPLFIATIPASSVGVTAANYWYQQEGLEESMGSKDE